MALLELSLIGYELKRMIDSNDNNELAQEINLKTFEKVSQGQKQVKMQSEATEMSLKKLVNRKRGIYLTSLKRFIGIYEEISKIDIRLSEDKIVREEEVFSDLDIKQIKEMIDISGKELTTKQCAVKYLISGLGGLKAQQAKVNLSIAKMRSEQSKIIEKEAENICIELQFIQQKVDKFSEILAAMNIMLIKALDTTGNIINTNGKNKSKYTIDDLSKMRLCTNIAVALKDFVLEPVLDYNGEVCNQCIASMEKTEKYLQDINLELSR